MDEALTHALGQVALAAKAVVALYSEDESDEMTWLRNALESLDTIHPGPLEAL